MTAYRSAAQAFAELVHRIPDDAWERPGLGEWDVRALVGHTSRSLTTVLTYLKTRAQREDVTSPQQYYRLVTPEALGIDPADVAERGRQAGRDLGDDPAAAVDALAAQALEAVAAAGDPLIEVIGGQGIRLRNYLPTRVFELVVHSTDIARALDLSFTPPADALEEALVLAARIAADGQGVPLLMALTGREPLPPSFSVV
ncbi:maleylpyruvate isomerase family mycothiol-dependent enzyme [Mycolicibacterium phlei]